MRKQRRGFAAMDPDKQRALASKGGKVTPHNFKNDHDHAAAAGRKGGLKRIANLRAKKRG
jgi:general stress protein YciG